MKGIFTLLVTLLLTQGIALAGGYRPFDVDYFAKVFWILPLLALALLGVNLVLHKKVIAILVFMLAVANIVFCLIVGIGRPLEGDSRTWILFTSSTFISALLVSLMLSVVGMSKVTGDQLHPRK